MESSPVETPRTGWRRFARTMNRVASVGLVLTAGALALVTGWRSLLGAAAGGALLLIDVHALAWLILQASRGRVSRRVIVLALLPAKFLLLIGAVWASIVVLELDPLGFLAGVSAVVVGIVVAGALGQSRRGRQQEAMGEPGEGRPQ